MTIISIKESNMELGELNRVKIISPMISTRLKKNSASRPHLESQKYHPQRTYSHFRSH